MNSIDETLGRDHARLDGILKELQAALLGPDWGTARACFDRFSRDLRHHMDWEETDLFPSLRPGDAATERHIESLLIDHERIRKTMDEIQGSLTARSTREGLDLLHDLVLFLKGHNDDEEHGAYVDADRKLGEKVRKEMLDRFRA